MMKKQSELEVVLHRFVTKTWNSKHILQDDFLTANCQMIIFVHLIKFYTNFDSCNEKSAIPVAWNMCNQNGKSSQDFFLMNLRERCKKKMTGGTPEVRSVKINLIDF